MIEKLNKNPFEILLNILENTIDKLGNDLFKDILKEIKKIFDAELIFLIKKDNFNVLSSNKSIPSIIDISNMKINSKTIINENNTLKDSILNKYTETSKFYHYVTIKTLKKEAIAYIFICTKDKILFSKELNSILKICAKKVSKELLLLEKNKKNTEENNKLKKLAILDGLTGLYNRRYFEKVCSDVFLQVKRTDIKANLSYLDLDNFKSINDKFGHLDGDYVLKKFGKILIEHSRKGVDYIFRLGGEEFAIISLNTQLRHSYDHLARIMIKTIETFEKTKYKEITFSVGLVEFSEKFNSYEDIVSLADKKMYRAKKSGKNTIVK